MLVQSLDSLRTHNSWHGHLPASWHRCHAGKGWAPGKVVAHPQGRLSTENGQRVRSASQRCARPPRAGLWLGNFILNTDLMMWTLSELSHCQSFLSFLFFTFCLQLGRWQIPCGWMAIILQEEGSREHFFLGKMGTGEPCWFRQQNIKQEHEIKHSKAECWIGTSFTFLPSSCVLCRLCLLLSP